MKRFVALILLIALFSGFCVAGTALGVKNSGFGEVVKVYVLIGQSNMVGHAATSGLPSELKESRPDIPTYFIDQWRDLAPGLNQAFSSSMFGPEITFGRSILEKNEGRKIALIKSAKGATCLYADWKPGSGPQWLDLVEDVNDAMEVLSKDYHPVIVGFIWMQGEWDSLNQTKANAYEQNLTDFIAAVRTEFSVPDCPFIIGQISESPAWVYGSTVRQAQFNVSENVANTGLVITSDLPIGGDNYHYTTPGMTELGYRFANEMDKLDKDVCTPIYLNYLKSICNNWTMKLSADLYLGESFDDVNDANNSSTAYVGNFSNNSYLPETLANDSTYYWRIDEIDANGTQKGDIWQFTTGTNNTNIGWWKLDNSTQDLSGYDNDGIAFGEPAIVDDSSWAKCISFDGDDDYIHIPNESAFDLTTQMTISVWFRLNEDVEEGLYTIVSKGDSFSLYIDTYSHITIFMCNYIGIPIQSMVDIFDGQWHHVAAVYDGVERAIYIDGVKDKSIPSTASMFLNDNNLVIGSNEIDPDAKFDGQIREVRVHSSRLSDDEILSLSKTNNYSPSPFDGQDNVGCNTTLAFLPEQWMKNILGDLNGDFVVDFKDYALYANDWLSFIH